MSPSDTVAAVGPDCLLCVKRDQVSGSPGKPFLVPGKSQARSRVGSLVETCHDCIVMCPLLLPMLLFL